MIDAKFEILSGVVKTALSKVESCSLTADIWTDTGNNQSYLGVTAHYLDEAELKSMALTAHPLDQAHTKEYIAGMLRNVCVEWNIDLDKVSVIVTDGGANIVSAAKNVFGDARHVICVDHSLSRITTVAIDQSPLFEILLTKIRSIVAFFKKSINAADEIRALQLKEVSSDADILKLIKDEPTRWGSNYAMLERFIKLADKVSLILLRYTSVQMLTGSELAAATEGRDLLQPVAHTITELEGETVSLSGKVIPLLKNMKRNIDSMSPTTEPVRQLKTMFQAQYERKFKDIEFVDTFSIATLLDPRFKTLYLCPLAHAKVLKNVSDMVQIANKNSTTNPNKISSFAPKAGSNNLWNFHHQMISNKKNFSILATSVNKIVIIELQGARIIFEP
ncbi:E3 SUMO-protein ligase ZBED1-like [Wyeomyia smithii]|uniref:E3 SUMO-protein ligase ZBED1-like n=1 Tax=Wyeomyia smithii TaxID=174621 RepID=UPI0024680D32|nr:E3 SUMO-protein ligase ZBED1-like [Wyeomyia smithii]